jgi:glycerol-3-phosphate acyltransferase PlsY
VAGHNWPVFLGFRGGRGEATTIGILLALLPVSVLIVAIPAVAVLLTRKNVIIASAVLFIILLLVNWWRHVPGMLVFYAIALPVMVGLTHFSRVWRAQRTVGNGET